MGHKASLKKFQGIKIICVMFSNQIAINLESSNTNLTMSDLSDISRTMPTFFDQY